MSRNEKDFLLGFEKAARLTHAVLVSPPCFTTARDYLKHVADLHANSQDLLHRGVAVGCLVAFGKA